MHHALAGLECFSFGSLANSEVVQLADVARWVRIGHSTHGEERGKYSAVFTACHDFAASSNNLRLAARLIALQVLIMVLPIVLSHQQADISTHYLRGRKSEQVFGRAIEELDAAVMINRDDGIDGRVEQGLQFMGFHSGPAQYSPSGGATQPGLCLLTRARKVGRGGVAVLNAVEGKDVLFAESRLGGRLNELRISANSLANRGAVYHSTRIVKGRVSSASPQPQQKEDMGIGRRSRALTVSSGQCGKLDEMSSVSRTPERERPMYRRRAEDDAPDQLKSAAESKAMRPVASNEAR